MCLMLYEKCLFCMIQKWFNQINCCNWLWIKRYCIQCGDTTCDNWFHHLYQNEYNISEYSNEFDKIHGVKKCC